jgi:hypothetical protein
MKSIKYTRRHYIDTAEMIAAMPKKQREGWIKKWVAVFTPDNPRFDEARFREACNP